MINTVPIHRLAVAPMLDRTDRHCRYLLRQITRHTLLYTEMVTSTAILHGRGERLLAFDPAEHPLALQLGGSQPSGLAACARIGAEHGFDEINLNVGCPSDRVQSGRFGACLMAEPELVAECVAAMSAASELPVSVKTRIGIDDRDSYEELAEFVGTVAPAGCRTFIIHARKAWLQGLSPKQNRTVPPLQYHAVYRLKQQFPHLEIVINGGINTLEAARRHLQQVDGVMIGRAAYHDPWLLATADAFLFGAIRSIPTRSAVVHAMLPYVERELRCGTPLKQITRHMSGLFQGMPGARCWRRHLSEQAWRAGAGTEVLLEALHAVQQVGNSTRQEGAESHG